MKKACFERYFPFSLSTLNTKVKFKHDTEQENTRIIIEYIYECPRPTNWLINSILCVLIEIFSGVLLYHTNQTIVETSVGCSLHNNMYLQKIVEPKSFERFKKQYHLQEPKENTAGNNYIGYIQH